MCIDQSLVITSFGELTFLRILLWSSSFFTFFFHVLGLDLWFSFLLRKVWISLRFLDFLTWASQVETKVGWSAVSFDSPFVSLVCSWCRSSSEEAGSLSLESNWTTNRPHSRKCSSIISNRLAAFIQKSAKLTTSSSSTNDQKGEEGCLNLYLRVRFDSLNTLIKRH